MITPGPTRTAQGSTALAADSSAHVGERPRHPVGNALRAVKVFATAAVGVVLLGEYADDR